jgi:hypothetical protein
MATLRDLGPQPFETAPVGERPVTAPDDRWVVLVSETGPVSAVAPGTTLAEGARPPGILVAAADLDLQAALHSDAFSQFAEASALVLTEPRAGDAGEPGIAGVVSGPTLTQLMFRGATRGIFGPVLPGAPSIPLIARSCGYLEAGMTCATGVSFRARPYPMPDCPNNRGLTTHLFVW